MRWNLNAENYKGFNYSVMNQIQLKFLDKELMFINEPWINFRHRTTYGWVPVWKKGIIDVNIFRMLFIVWLSGRDFMRELEFHLPTTLIHS